MRAGRVFPLAPLPTEIREALKALNAGLLSVRATLLEDSGDFLDAGPDELEGGEQGAGPSATATSNPTLPRYWCSVPDCSYSSHLKDTRNKHQRTHLANVERDKVIRDRN